MTSERLDNTDLQLKGTSWKTDLGDFVDEFDSWHDIEGLSYIDVMMI